MDRYMKALAEALGVTVEEVASIFPTFECRTCASVYSDPWLTPEGMYELYGKGAAQHLAGWEIFYGWANDAANAKASQDRARVWRLLEEHVGPVRRYGQLNCPFFGPLLYFNDLEESDVAKRDRVAGAFSQIQDRYLHPFDASSLLNRVKRAWRGRVCKESLVVDEVNEKNANLMGSRSLSRAIRRGKTARGRNGTVSAEGGLPRPRHGGPEERYLVFEPSSCFWSTNCTSLNASCRAIAGELLKTPVVTLSDIEREGKQFDLFCVFNALDHFLEPKQLLRRLLNVSRFVFFDTHKNDPGHSFSRQHFYVFGTGALEAMADPDWK